MAMPPAPPGRGDEVSPRPFSRSARFRRLPQFSSLHLLAPSAERQSVWPSRQQSRYTARNETTGIAWVAAGWLRFAQHNPVDTSTVMDGLPTVRRQDLGVAGFCEA